MRLSSSFRAPSRRGGRAAAMTVVVALVAGLAAGFTSFGVAAPAAAADSAAAAEAEVAGATVADGTAPAVETPAPSPTASPSPTATPSPAASPTPAPTASAAPSPSVPVAPKPSASASPEPTASPEAPGAPSPVPTPSATTAPTNTASPSPRSSSRMTTMALSAAAAASAAAPTEVWNEDFGDGGSETRTIEFVTGSSTTGYTGDAYWRDYSECNGLTVTYNTTNFSTTEMRWGWWPVETPNCDSGDAGNARVNVRRLADVLGQVSAKELDPGASGSKQATRSNRALVEWTSSGSGTSSGTLVARRDTGITLSPSPTGARYYVASVDVAEASCGMSDARIRLSLTEAGAQGSPVSPCASSAPAHTSPALNNNANPWQNGGAWVRAGRFYSDVSQLATPAQAAAFRPTIRNTNTGSGGNDFAVDNLRVVDATPKLDMEFAESSATVFHSTPLTFTVTNTAEFAAKADWSFENALPAGMTYVDTESSTCGDGRITSPAGADTISYDGGDLGAGSANGTCTVTVNVMADRSGTHTNRASAVSTTGLDAPANTSIAVEDGTTLTLATQFATPRTAGGDQFVLSLRQGSTVIASTTTAGSGTQVTTSPADAFPRSVQPGATYTIHQAPVSGTGAGYATSYSCVRGGTVIASGASGSASLTIPTDQVGAEIVCTFTNAAQTARFACDVNHFYTVSSTGAIRQGDIVTGNTQAVGTLASSGSEQVNGLAIRQLDGVNEAYALVRADAAASNTTVSRIVKVTTGGAATTMYSTPFSTGATAIAGGSDADGRYYFGGFQSGTTSTQGRFVLWTYQEGGAPTQLGYIETGLNAPYGNGDLAFDARGNLYILGAVSSGDAQAAIFTVTREALTAARTAPSATQNITYQSTFRKTITGTDTGNALSSVNGIAFSPRGTAYLSDSSNIYEFDPTTWTRVGGTARVPHASSDLASCSSPATITVQKNVVGRAAAADQFALTLAQGSETIATATTSGNATGVQGRPTTPSGMPSAQQIGPLPAPIGTTFRVSEAMASGSSSPIGAYGTRFECWAGGVLIASGATAVNDVTMPDTLSINVSCTYFNTPSPVSRVTVTKRILNPATGATDAAAGWTVGVTATPTTGNATALPSQSTQQETGADGSASWTVLYGSAASRATVVVSEVQKAGHQFVSGSCTVNGTARAVTFTTSGSTVSGTITDAAPNQPIACTFVNRPVATLTLVKSVAFGSAPATSWTLSATRSETATAALAGFSGDTGTTRTVTAGTPYRLSEASKASAAALTAPYVQAGDWACRTAGGQTVPVSSQGDVTLSAGAAVTCTVTNTTATISLVKSLRPGFAAGVTPATWNLTATPSAGSGLSTVTVAGAASEAAANTINVRPGTTYTLSEALASATSTLPFRLVSLERFDAATSTWVDVTSATVTAPAAGRTAVYRFVNAPIVPPTLPLTGGLGSDTFLVVGAGILALTLALVLWQQRWRFRKTLVMTRLRSSSTPSTPHRTIKGKNTMSKSITTRVTATVGAIAIALLGSIAVAAPASAANVSTTQPVTLTIHKHAKTTGNGTTAGTGAELTSPAPGGVGINGVQFSVQRVGSIDLTTDAGWNTVEAIQTRIAGGSTIAAALTAENQSLGTAQTVTTATQNGAAGVASVPGVVKSLYLVTEGTAPSTVVEKAAPFLVTLPQANNANSTWNYDVHVYPKNGYSTVTKSEVAPTAAEIAAGRDLVRWNIVADVPVLPVSTPQKALTEFVISDTVTPAQLAFVTTAPAGVAAATTVTATNAAGTAVTLAAGDYALTASPTSELAVTFTSTGLAKLNASTGANALAGGKVTLSVLTRVLDVPTAGVITNHGGTRINGVVNGKVNGVDNGAAVTAATRFADVQVFSHVAGANTPLAGAKYALLDNNDQPVVINGVPVTATANAQGVVLFENVPVAAAGTTYKVRLTEAPAGYLDPSATVISVDVKPGTPDLTGDVKVAAKNYQPFAFSQTPAWVLPLTGGDAGAIFMIGGSAILATALGLALIAARRKNKVQPA
ncbi:SpaH/EbpB family LPXTG-anchored major pilin [Microbacterium sp. 179-B 1A2 NHS]|uniref:SpaH/EbpB family LPXTG-anchored major pilin n=1 Tax=Microbacterium sp. 179-B 1A2 NHS TaxID=3142383 RepID=UPI0039A1ACF9